MSLIKLEPQIRCDVSLVHYLWSLRKSGLSLFLHCDVIFCFYLRVIFVTVTDLIKIFVGRYDDK
jgi:hypothetical protein